MSLRFGLSTVAEDFNLPKGHLAEISHPDVPDERLVACFNNVIRTSEPAGRLSADDAVRTYKSLGTVEKSFRTFKGVDILVRPIRHRNADRVRALSSLMYVERLVDDDGYVKRPQKKYDAYRAMDVEMLISAKTPIASGGAGFMV